MSNRYFNVIRSVGGAAVIVLATGWLFSAISPSVLAQETQDSVLVRAVPFVGTFVAIILVFAMVIALVSIRLNGKIPVRTYRPIERTIMIGIGAGIIFLFQPWIMIAYVYGFSLLLLATLSFILWGHVIPKSARSTMTLPDFNSRDRIAGFVAGIVILLGVFGGLYSISEPQEPYGLRQRVWDYMDEAEQAEVAAEALSSFQNISVPFFLIVGLIPASLFFFAARELSASAARTEPNVSTSDGRRPAHVTEMS